MAEYKKTRISLKVYSSIANSTTLTGSSVAAPQTAQFCRVDRFSDLSQSNGHLDRLYKRRAQTDVHITARARINLMFSFTAMRY